MTYKNVKFNVWVSVPSFLLYRGLIQRRTLPGMEPVYLDLSGFTDSVLILQDVGGQDKIRPLWRHYYTGTQVGASATICRFLSLCLPPVNLEGRQ